MLFKHTALLTGTSIIALASAVAIPDGYKSVTTLDSLSSLAASSNFVIASSEYGTELNIAYSLTGEGSPVVAYAEQGDVDANQQVSPKPTLNFCGLFDIFHLVDPQQRRWLSHKLFNSKCTWRIILVFSRCNIQRDHFYG